MCHIPELHILKCVFQSPSIPSKPRLWLILTGREPGCRVSDRHLHSEDGACLLSALAGLCATLQKIYLAPNADLNISFVNNKMPNTTIAVL